MLRVVEDTVLDAQFCSGGPTDGGLPGCPILQREAGTDITNRDGLDVSCNVTVSIPTMCETQGVILLRGVEQMF